MKGYSQQEIVSIPHVSQFTVSRDIAFLHNRFENTSVNLGQLAFEQLYNAIEANNELLPRGWNILNSSKKDKKLHMKVMNFISGCYDNKFEYIQAGPVLLYISLKTKEYMKMEKYLKDRGIVIGNAYDDNTIPSLMKIVILIPASAFILCFIDFINITYITRKYKHNYHMNA